MFPVEHIIFAIKTNDMKRFLILALLAISFSANAQQRDTTTVIQKGYGNFTIDGRKFPLNSIIVNISIYQDTGSVELDLVNHTEALGRGDVLIPKKKRARYINGTENRPFLSMTELKGYCDSFLYSH